MFGWRVAKGVADHVGKASLEQNRITHHGRSVRRDLDLHLVESDVQALQRGR